MALPTSGSLRRLAGLIAILTTAGLLHASGAMAQDLATKEFFLGVSCAPLTDELRDELKVDREQGLVVMDVIPGSPADKGGVQKDDILIAVGDKDLVEVADLISAVSAAGGNEMTITLARDGKRQDAKITPERRRDIKFYMPTPGGRAPVGVQIIRPGRMVPPRMALMMHHPDLPDDMSVTISKHGKEAAKIKVEQGDKTWEVTENTLDQLPDDVRPHVEPMVGRMAIKLPPGVGDVLTYVPNSEELQQQINEAREAARGARRDAEKAAAEARHEGEAAAREAEQRARDIARQARERAGEIRRSAEKAALDTADDAIDRGQRWLDRQLDSRFLELDRRIEELRGIVDSLRGEKIPTPDQDEAEKPADQPKN